MTEDSQIDDRPTVVEGEHVPLSDPEFKDQLAAVIPHLRAFGRSLSGSRDLADDLVQETLLKAWAAVGSSRVDLQACKLEYSIVSPK